MTRAVIGTGETRSMQIGEAQRMIVVEPLESPLADHGEDVEPEPISAPDPTPIEVPTR